MKKLSLFLMLGAMMVTFGADAAATLRRTGSAGVSTPSVVGNNAQTGPKVLATTTYVDNRVDSLPVGNPENGGGTERVTVWIEE